MNTWTPGFTLIAHGSIAKKGQVAKIRQVLRILRSYEDWWVIKVECGQTHYSTHHIEGFH